MIVMIMITKVEVKAVDLTNLAENAIPEENLVDSPTVIMTRIVLMIAERTLDLEDLASKNLGPNPSRGSNLLVPNAIPVSPLER